MDVLAVGTPLEKIVDCDLRSELVRLDHAHVGVEGTFLLGRLG